MANLKLNICDYSCTAILNVWCKVACETIVSGSQHL